MKITLLKLIGLGFLALSLILPQTVLSFEEEEDDCPDCPKEEESIKLDEEERVKLDDVFVHAFGGGAIKYTPTSVIVDVDKYIKAGKVDRIEDILVNIAGINVLKGSGADPQQVIMMRGFDDSRYIVAMDGRPITGSTGQQNTSIDWSTINLAEIEKIEIVRGGASAAYDAAIGGVINIIMKKGTKRDTAVPRMTYQQDLSMIFDYSNPFSHTERITADGGVGDLTYFLNFGHTSDDGYLKNSQFRGEDYSSRFGYRFPFEGILSVTYKGARQDKENPVVNDPRIVPGVTLPLEDPPLPSTPTNTVGTDVVPYDPDYPTMPWDADTIRSTGTTVSFDYRDRNIYKERFSNSWDASYEQPINNTMLKLYAYTRKVEENDYYVSVNGTQVSRDNSKQIERHRGGGATWTLEPFEDNSLTLGYSTKRAGAEYMPKVIRISAGYFEDLWVINPKWTVKTGLRVSNVRHNVWSDSKRTKYREWFVLPKFSLTHNFRPGTNIYVSASKDYDVPGC